VSNKIIIQINDVLGKAVLLTGSVWQDIQIKHPEVKGLEERIKETISQPEVITKSLYDERVWLYYRFFKEVLKGKYLVVIVKSVSKEENYISTIYVTDKRRGGEVVWKAE
jgi:hypothetical protein